jgi:hypothetical protein
MIVTVSYYTHLMDTRDQFCFLLKRKKLACIGFVHLHSSLAPQDVQSFLNGHKYFVQTDLYIKLPPDIVIS